MSCRQLDARKGARRARKGQPPRRRKGTDCIETGKGQTASRLICEGAGWGQSPSVPLGSDVSSGSTADRRNGRLRTYAQTGSERNETGAHGADRLHGQSGKAQPHAVDGRRENEQRRSLGGEEIPGPPGTRRGCPSARTWKLKEGARQRGASIGNRLPHDRRRVGEGEVGEWGSATRRGPGCLSQSPMSTAAEHACSRSRSAGRGVGVDAF